MADDTHSGFANVSEDDIQFSASGHTTKHMKHGRSCDIETWWPSVEMSHLGWALKWHLEPQVHHISMSHSLPCIIGILSLCPVHFIPSVLWCCRLGGRKGIRPVKNWVVGCWRGYLSGARCRLAYGPADATATHCLGRPGKAPLNGCVCVSCTLHEL